MKGRRRVKKGKREGKKRGVKLKSGK